MALSIKGRSGPQEARLQLTRAWLLKLELIDPSPLERLPPGQRDWLRLRFALKGNGPMPVLAQLARDRGVKVQTIESAVRNGILRLRVAQKSITPGKDV